MGFQIGNRRYIGSKKALLPWIVGNIPERHLNGTFFDAFAGTGIVSSAVAGKFQAIILNDLLYSNQSIYRGFFGTENFDLDKLSPLIQIANNENPGENYFGNSFGGKYFTHNDANLIGELRSQIDVLFPDESDRHRHIAIASLLYSADRSAITVGHYEAYLKTGINRPFSFDLIAPSIVDAKVFREDANSLAKKIKSDVVYLDPPYNSRQYSRFYHVLETLTKWDEPELFGVALKPKPENLSDYSRSGACDSLADLVANLESKFILISYNNTYNSKSSSSQNKITLDQIEEIARLKGKTNILEKPHKHFNSGKTSFADHREYLFTIEVEN